MDLIPDQCVDAVTLCESFHQVVLVLPDPLDKVRGNAGVQGSIAFYLTEPNHCVFYQNATAGQILDIIPRIAPTRTAP